MERTDQIEALGQVLRHPSKALEDLPTSNASEEAARRFLVGATRQLEERGLRGHETFVARALLDQARDPETAAQKVGAAVRYVQERGQLPDPPVVRDFGELNFGERQQAARLLAAYKHELDAEGQAVAAAVVLKRLEASRHDSDGTTEVRHEMKSDEAVLAVTMRLGSDPEVSSSTIAGKLQDHERQSDTDKYQNRVNDAMHYAYLVSAADGAWDFPAADRDEIASQKAEVADRLRAEGVDPDSAAYSVDRLNTPASNRARAEAAVALQDGANRARAKGRHQAAEALAVQADGAQARISSKETRGLQRTRDADLEL